MSYPGMYQDEVKLKNWDHELDQLIGGIYNEACVYRGNVTGLTHHRYEDVKRVLHKYLLVIKPAPDNKYDARAQGVWLQSANNDNEVQIGWIPKALNSIVHRAVNEGCTLRVKILNHNPEASDYQEKLFIEVIAERVSVIKTLLWATPKTTGKASWSSPEANAQAKMYAALAPQNTDSKTLEQPFKETTMSNKVQSLISKNVNLGQSAAFLEAGRIANSQLSKIASKKLPMLVRGYADTPFGTLLIANAAALAQEHFRPEDERLKKLVEAMVVSAYQEVLQQFDVEEFIEDLVSNTTIKKALNKVQSINEHA